MITPSSTKTARSKKLSRKPSPSSASKPRKGNVHPKTSISENSLLKRLLDESHRTKTLPRETKVLIALSGGPDSTALLTLFVALRKKRSLTIAAAHVNYRLRGEDSEQDERFVKKLCQSHGIPLFLSRPAGMSGKNEETLREVRYRFFEKVRNKIGFDVVAVAHTLDDQAETVLLRLLRGSGALGLSGIRPAHKRVIRPLLSVPKSDLIDFLNESGIPFRTDVTNTDTSILRNRIRRELLPLLEKEYQPNIRHVLARTASSLSEQDTDACSELSVSTPGGIILSRASFLALPEKAQSDELRRLFRLVSGTGKNPGASFVREAKKLILSQKGKIRRFASNELKIEARGDTVLMIRA